MTQMNAAEASELFRGAPHQMIDVGEGRVAHRKVGTGPDVLFVHGWPVSGATFRTLLPHLVEHVTCHLIDLPGAGSSEFGPDTVITVEQHFQSIRRVVDALGADEIAVVGHDSGGLMARHALAGDSRVRAMALINTETSGAISFRFRSFIASRHVPGFGRVLGWLAGKPSLRRNRFVLGDAFADSSLLDGEFDEFFLRPLHEEPARLAAAMKLLDSFEMRHVKELADVHGRINVPVKMVWGDKDPFFPLRHAQAMVGTFSNATLDVIEGAGLFSHEERPDRVAKSLLEVIAS
ncbi:MAG: alpha/beta hydrolase [Acidimicrobiales bacterium]